MRMPPPACANEADMFAHSPSTASMHAGLTGFLSHDWKMFGMIKYEIINDGMIIINMNGIWISNLNGMIIINMNPIMHSTCKKKCQYMSHYFYHRYYEVYKKNMLIDLLLMIISIINDISLVVLNTKSPVTNSPLVGSCWFVKGQVTWMTSNGYSILSYA